MNRRLPKLRNVSLLIAGGAALLGLLLPVTVSAAGGQQVDVCGSTAGVTSQTTIDNIGKCNHFIDTYINPAVKVLTALVGITAVVSIILGGIQYSTSADDSGEVTKAKQRIFNTVLGLVAYVFLIALLNYLVPGGIW